MEQMESKIPRDDNNQPKIIDLISKYSTGVGSKKFMSVEISPNQNMNISDFERYNLSPLFYSVIWKNPKHLSLIDVSEETVESIPAFQLAQLLSENGKIVMMHITCVDMSYQTLYTILKKMQRLRIRNILALQGDIVRLNMYQINLNSVNERVRQILTESVEKKPNQAAWLLKALSVIDLTTLAGDDTRCNVSRLCQKAVDPLPLKYYTELGFNTADGFVPITTAAVCVYPSRVADAASVIGAMSLNNSIEIAAVATGFPTGQYSLKTRLEEISFAIESGATEIDVVIDRSLVLTGQWDKLYNEILQMRNVCGTTHMKVILAIGELGTMENVYKAAMISMQAGCDFIKTSTGKESVNATLAVGVVMCRAIRQHYKNTGVKIGLKPAGGIKTWKDAINWLILVKEELGDDWLTPKLFRIGASSLLGDIERWFYEYINDRKADPCDFSFI